MIVYTMSELAELLKVHKDTARKLILGRQIRAFQITKNGSWRITEDAVFEYIKKQESK